MRNHGSTSRRQTHGIPTSCWCGNEIVPFVSKTKKNPYRRFYRCKVAMERKFEDHLFKWEDEAFCDEIRMLEAHQRKLQDDVEEQRSSLMNKEEDDSKKPENSHVGCIGTIEWLCGKLCNRE
ncbi:hypothetical protein Bca101_062316 [Brassica carinata]